MSEAVSVPEFAALQAYSPAPDLLAGRVVLVTGAADGIGRAAARVYARHGASTVLLDRNAVGLEALRELMVSDEVPEPELVEMDLAAATPADYRALAEKIGERFGRLDGLLNNAGWIGALAPFEHTEPRVWSQALAVNLVAPYFLTQWCMPLVRRSEDPALVFSLHDARRAHWGGYGIAKAGLEAFMRMLADEYHAGSMAPVRVLGIDPGPVATESRRRHYPGEPASAHPAPESVTGPYLYAMGPDARGLTGIVIRRG